jgi:hypothetical protein
MGAKISSHKWLEAQGYQPEVSEGGVPPFEQLAQTVSPSRGEAASSKQPFPPLIAGPNWPLPRKGYTSTSLPQLATSADASVGSVLRTLHTGN